MDRIDEAGILSGNFRTVRYTMCDALRCPPFGKEPVALLAVARLAGGNEVRLVLGTATRQRLYVVNRLCRGAAVHAWPRGQDRGVRAPGDRASDCGGEHASAPGVVPSAVICRQLFRVARLSPARVTDPLLAEKAAATHGAGAVRAHAGRAVTALPAPHATAAITGPHGCCTGQAGSAGALELPAASTRTRAQACGSPSSEATHHETASRRSRKCARSSGTQNSGGRFP